MAVELEFKVEKGFDFAQAFAARFNLSVDHDRVLVPDSLGTGSIKEVYLDNGLGLCFHQYRLKQPFVLKRMASPGESNLLTLRFSSAKTSVTSTVHPSEQEPIYGIDYAVEVATSNLFAEITLSPDQAVKFLAITLSRQALLDLLHLDDQAGPMRDTLRDTNSFVFHEGMTPQMEQTFNQLCAVNESTTLAHLLYQNKAHELIYLLFTKLLTRPVVRVTPVDPADAQKLYMARSIILTDLSQTPQLPQLARQIGMSQTRMNRLFRQIFGDSLYNYYQAARLAEAARLLARLSVSETGYRLGFTNLSHFTRLFERHFQLKPKQYKATLPPLKSDGWDYYAA
ncbi:helix-turn-helix domain-containing protein [Spirosoma arcticum]